MIGYGNEKKLSNIEWVDEMDFVYEIRKWIANLAANVSPSFYRYVWHLNVGASAY